MGHFHATIGLMTDTDIEYRSMDAPDEATLFALMQSLHEYTSASINLYYHDSDDEMRYDLLLISPCSAPEKRLMVWYRNTWSDTYWLKLDDPAERDNDQEIAYRLENGEEAFEQKRYTVLLERAQAAVTFFLRHGTIKRDEGWHQ